MRKNYFTHKNIVSLVKAVPYSDGTLESITSIAKEQFDCEVQTRTLSGWMTRGRKATKQGQKADPHARFYHMMDKQVKKHCVFTNRNTKEMDLAMSILAKLCDCGEEMEQFEDGSYPTMCDDCKSLDLNGD